MASLFWNVDRRTLPEDTNILSVKFAIEKMLRESGFTDVRRNDLDISCSAPGVFLSIAHFQIDGITFWEQVIGAGDGGNLDLTRNTVNDVAARVRGIKFF